jgi:hypothetical protein
MPHIDPIVRFWIGVVVTAAIGVGNGTLELTNAVPGAWIPTVTAWCGIIAFLGSSLLTALNGMGSTAQSRIASAASVDGVSKIVTTPALADAAPSDKVIPTPTGKPS